MTRPRPVHALLAAGILLAAVSSQADVPAWRGDGMGIFSSAPAPVKWTTDEGVLWKTAMPDWANACPIIVGSRMFVTIEPNTLVCLSTTDGSVAWKQANPRSDTVPAGERTEYAAKAAECAKLESESRDLNNKIRRLDRELKGSPANADALKAERDELRKRKSEVDGKKAPLSKYGSPRAHKVNGYATPTPVTDGKNVYVLFGDGVVSCYTLDGQRQWIRFVANAKHGWGHSASPLLIDGKLILHIADTVYALAPADGETIWTTNSGSKWGTPLGFQIGDEWALMTTGGDVVRVADGKVVASRIADLPWNGPIVRDGVLYVIDEAGAKALRIPAAMSDSVSFEEIWTAKPEKNRYYATPVYVDGLLYAINRKGTLSVLDAKTGEIVYAKKLDLGGTTYPSPAVADGKIYISSDTGKTVVIKPGRTFTELATNSLEGFRSTPVFDGGRMYIRGLKNVYCIAGLTQ